MIPELPKKTSEDEMNDRRRHTDRRQNERRIPDTKEDGARLVTWEEQQFQFLARFVLAALGAAYYNIGEPVARNEQFLFAVNVMFFGYFLLTTIYYLHAWRRVNSPFRWRLAMWTDLLAVSFTAFGDANVMSLGFLVYLVIILGNGMRYGSRRFAEAAIGSFVLGGFVLSFRLSEYVNALSVAGIFLPIFIGVIALYSYSLLRNNERARAQLEFASTSDMLTGLLNRRGLYEKTDSLFKLLDKHKRRVAILFVDLDGFKAVNDFHGHHMGDQVLKEIAAKFRATIRESDIAARLGGDEFVIIMPDTSLDQATLVAKRLQSEITRQATGRERDIAVSLSIGMGEAPDHGRDLESVLACVDNAMYQSKSTFGRGGIRRADGIAVVHSSVKRVGNL
jgi:diguanylate cyclase (GGDEF)-like protein